MGMDKGGLKLQRGALLRFVDEEKGEMTEALFIGPEDNSDFVVVPLSETMLLKKEGEPLHARCQFQGDMVEFRSTIVEIFDRPVHLWRIKVPTEVNTFDLRDHKRIQCSVSANIEAIHRGQFITGIMRDVSKSGARCVFQRSEEAENAFNLDQTITLRCAFPGIPGEQSTEGTITEILKSETELSIGIQFAESVWWVPPYH
ncbi:PilZ domain-containing protein [Desulfosarcina sp.]|uniref:PilZ domain-containing protein n=1 Tax=Desulfosarcina sp. TaxID=2027861 RepID=UPI003566A47D